MLQAMKVGEICKEVVFIKFDLHAQNTNRSENNNLILVEVFFQKNFSHTSPHLKLFVMKEVLKKKTYVAIYLRIMKY
jgi:hypothetical protein